MKKILTITAIVAFVFATSACKKDWTCECTVDVLGTKTTSSVTIKETKKKAKEACDAGDSSYSVCEIK